MKIVEQEEELTVHITPQEYERLKKASDMLDCLIAAGVDNWDGYDYACELMEPEKEEGL